MTAIANDTEQSCGNAPEGACSLSWLICISEHHAHPAGEVLESPRFTHGKTVVQRGEQWSEKWHSCCIALAIRIREHLLFFHILGLPHFDLITLKKFIVFCFNKVLSAITSIFPRISGQLYLPSFPILLEISFHQSLLLLWIFTPSLSDGSFSSAQY